MKKILCTTIIFFIFLSLFLKVNAQGLLITPDNPDEKTFPGGRIEYCLLYTSPSPRDLSTSRMPSSA